MPQERGIELYDPSREQFNAVVQGIYESLVKQHLGLKSSAPFRDRKGSRLDVKHRLDDDTQRNLLNRAFAIATRQEQKYGRLHRGTQFATKKGRGRSVDRLSDREALDANRRDYEETLYLARKDESRRIVKEGKRKFVVYPDGLSYPSKAAATRAIKRLETKEEYGMVANPNHEGGWNLKDISRSFTDHEKGKARGKGRGAMKEWGKYKTAKAVGAKFVPPAKGRGTGDVEFKFFLVEQKRYMPQFLDEAGQPEEMYKYAPWYSYYTIQVVAPRNRFYNMPGFKDQRTGKWRNDVSAKFPHSVWRPAAWAAAGMTNKELVEYEFGDGEVVRKVVERTIGDGNKFNTAVYMEFNEAGNDLTFPEMGFNMEALQKSGDAIWIAESTWREGVTEALRQGAEGVSDYLLPTYPKIACEDQLIPVNDPRVNIGVLVRALKAMELLLKQQFRQADGSVSVPQAVTKDVYTHPMFKQLMPYINDWLMTKKLEPMVFPGGGMEAKRKGDTVQSYRERYIEPRKRVIYPLLQFGTGSTAVAPVAKKTEKEGRSSEVRTGSKQTGKIIERESINLRMVTEEPDTYFVFNDNIMKEPEDGRPAYATAKNMLGIPVKYQSGLDESAYLTDDDIEDPTVQQAINKAIGKVAGALNAGFTVVFPTVSIIGEYAEAPEDLDLEQEQIFELIDEKLSALRQQYTVQTNPRRRFAGGW